MSLAPDGCGVIDHDNLCLCDVVIPHPTGWVDDAIQDMWMGQEIVNLRGYVTLWESDDIINYLDDLVYTKDNWAKFSRKKEANADPETWAGQMRHHIKRLMADGTSSITSVMDELGLDMDDMNHILFTDRRTWTLETLVQFERTVLAGEHLTLNKLGEQFGMSYSSAERLASYWSVTFRKRRPELADVQVIDTLIADYPGLSNRELADMANARLSQGGLNVSVNGDRIRTRRYYLVNRKNK